MDKKYSKNLSEVITMLKEGIPILMLDDKSRENEGDLVVAAQKISEKSMNFLIQKGSGIVCLATTKEWLNHMQIPMMVPKNTNNFQTAFTVSIEAKNGISTGVSAKDRAHTIKIAIDDNATNNDIAMPGHVFPLCARDNGVLERNGHTEGSVDLMKIAQLKPAAVISELMNEDGSMSNFEQCQIFAHNHGLKVITIEEILFHRKENRGLW